MRLHSLFRSHPNRADRCLPRNASVQTGLPMEASISDVVKRLDDSNTQVGWETDYLGYETAMSAKNAPSSVLIGLDGGGSIHLGVQQDRILIEKKDGMRFCRIKGDKGNQQFPVMRSTKHLAAIKVERGARFIGNSPHAGVRNFSRDSDEQKLANQLHEAIAEAGENNVRSVKDELTKFVGLNKLCRLHFSTEPKDKFVLIPRDRVGYDGCENNPARNGFMDPVGTKMARRAKNPSVSASSSPAIRTNTPVASASNAVGGRTSRRRRRPRTNTAGNGSAPIAGAAAAYGTSDAIDQPKSRRTTRNDTKKATLEEVKVGSRINFCGSIGILRQPSLRGRKIKALIATRSTLMMAR